MRHTTELGFNPIEFFTHHTNGSVGVKPPEDFFRSKLPQNICYCVRHNARTVNEIADDLGVSPVYVENEAEYLEENGYLLKRGDRYLCNFIINEPTNEFLSLESRLYSQAAGEYVFDLWDTLAASGLLDDPDLRCGQKDKNYLLWALIPFITDHSGRHLMEAPAAFRQVATPRPDGTHNIFAATVMPPDTVMTEEYDGLCGWIGPMWNGREGRIIWRINSRWTDRGPGYGFAAMENDVRVLTLYEREQQEPLAPAEYAWLAQRGMITMVDGEAVWQVVTIGSKRLQKALLDLGDEVKARHLAALQRLRAAYEKAAMADIPPHLRKVRAYELQYAMFCDSPFLYHCIRALAAEGRLAEPAGAQKKALMTVIAYE